MILNNLLLIRNEDIMVSQFAHNYKVVIHVLSHSDGCTMPHHHLPTHNPTHLLVSSRKHPLFQQSYSEASRDTTLYETFRPPPNAPRNCDPICMADALGPYYSSFSSYLINLLGQAVLSLGAVQSLQISRHICLNITEHKGTPVSYL